MFWNKKQYAQLKVDSSKPFVAAYSHKPFADEKLHSKDPQLVFYKDEQKRYWCVRSGEFHVQWGIGEELDYSAHGTVILSRRRVKASTFRDVPADTYTNEGDVCYLYIENMEIDKATDGIVWRGYAPYIRNTVLQPFLRRLAERVPLTSFTEIYRNLAQEPEIKDFLESHKLDFKDAYLG